MGKLFKWSFVGFNLLMLVWVMAGMSNVSSSAAELSGSEQTAAAIGAGVGITILATIWIAGDIFLRLFVLLTRPKV